MPTDSQTDGTSNIVGDARSRLKQDRVKHIIGMRDIVQPKDEKDATATISRLAGSCPMGCAQKDALPQNGQPAPKSYMCPTCGSPIQSAHGQQVQQQGTQAGPTDTPPNPTAGQSQPKVAQQGQDSASQPRPRDVGQGLAAPAFPGHGMPGTQAPNANPQPPPGNAQPPPGQPAIGAVGPAQSILQQVMNLPVDQLDPIKRAIDQRMSVVRAPLAPPQQAANSPVDQAKPNFGMKTLGPRFDTETLETGSKVNWHQVAHFVRTHKKELAAAGVLVHEAVQAYRHEG